MLLAQKELKYSRGLWKRSKSRAINQLFSSLHRCKILERIVVDEAHIPILSDVYRPDMSRLVHTRP